MWSRRSTGDEGVFPTTVEGLAKLKPVVPEGTVTFGSQTHPADGNCGMIVCDRERARTLSKDPAVEVQMLSYAQARTKKGFMAMATVPATRAALQEAGVGIAQVKVIKTHNPFAVNDAYFAREMGVKIDAFNRFGSSLIYGHPQGPTGTRLDHRDDRGAGDGGRWAGTVRGLRRRRHGSRGRDPGRAALSDPGRVPPCDSSLDS